MQFSLNSKNKIRKVLNTLIKNNTTRFLIDIEGSNIYTLSARNKDLIIDAMNKKYVVNEDIYNSDAEIYFDLLESSMTTISEVPKSKVLIEGSFFSYSHNLDMDLTKLQKYMIKCVLLEL